MTARYPVKFELTDETLTRFGVTLYRIRATEDIPSRGVRKGDMGGFVQSTHLPSGDARVSGAAWVSGDARVYGAARVSGDARVSGAAEVYGDARVYGAARVYGDARVSGNAEVYERWHFLLVGPIGSEGVTASLYRTKSGHRLDVGCWHDGSLGTLMAEVKRRREHWTADDATQDLWVAVLTFMRHGRSVPVDATVGEHVTRKLTQQPTKQRNSHVVH